MATSVKITQEVAGDCEPGASSETMLITTDSFEKFEQEMSSSLDERQMRESTSTISEIRDDELSDPPSELEEITTQIKEQSISTSDDVSITNNSNDEDYLHNSEWINQPKHIFVLSLSGKPIYTR